MDRLGPREWMALQAIILIGRADGASVAANEIAAYLKKSLSYTEVVLIKLRQSGFLVSNRGPRGGYILGMKPSRITVADVMNTLRGEAEQPFSDDLVPVIDALNKQLHEITIESLL